MERIASWHQTHWDWRAAGNFILGGTGSGLAVSAALASLAGAAIPPLVFVVAALCVMSGLGLVWLEIGRPWRFLHVFFNPATSWMTRESLIAPWLLASLFSAAWWMQNPLTLLAGLFGAAFLYSQARVLTESKGIPAWRERRILALVVTTGLAEGASVLLLFAAISGVSIITAAWLALGFVLLRGLAWARYRERFRRQPAPIGTREALERIGRPFLLVGTAAPAAFAVLAIALPGSASVTAPLAAVLAIGGGWALKHAIVTRAAFNQGFAVPHLPVYAKLRSARGSKPGWS